MADFTAANSGQKLMSRDAPEPEPARAALVQRWLKDVAAAKAHWKPDFDRMRRNMEFANGKQYPNQKEQDDRVLVNITQRVIKTTVANLYAKDPTVVYTRRPKLDFLIWDGKPDSVVQAQQSLMMAAQQAASVGIDPHVLAPIQAMMADAQALLADVKQGTDRRKMLDNIGKALVICTNYFIDENLPGFKLQMKQMMRRARTTGVGYVRLGFQRAMELSAQQTTAIADMAERIATIGRLTADLKDGEIQPDSAEAAELQLAMATMQAEPESIIREGLIFDFPHSTRLIPSVSTEKLMGWVGAEWVAEEIILSADRVKEVYGVDLGKSYTAYRPVVGSPQNGEVRRVADRSNGLACIWHIYDKNTGMQLVVAEGHPDFLREPGTPEIFIEQFFPFFAVTFNDVEDEGKLFPKSDVELLMHVQKEYNRKKEAARQHRIANRPLYVSPKGSFEDEDKKALSSYPAHAVIELNGLDKGRPVSDILMPVQKIGVDPNLYETAGDFEDMQRMTGNAEANLGGTGGGTATESSIAETSRQGSLGLDADDLDEMLTSLFRAAGMVLMTELSADTVKEIAGPGAVWPELSRAEVVKELWLGVKAGSSGRPNQARDAATFERIYPVLLQVPGISPRWLAEKAVRIADDDIDLEDAIIDGLPSITSQNAIQQMPTGDPATDPASQGGAGKGAAPAAKPGPPAGAAQPGFPGGPVGGMTH